MSEFVPVNSLEMSLRTLLADRNSPLWNFYTPLAAAPLWIIAKNYPELDGSEAVAPEGRNPDVCVFQGPEESWIGIYTAECRARAVMEKYKISPQDMTCISAPGYQLLQWLSEMDSELCVNLGLKECQKVLDADMVDILLSRGEPAVADVPSRQVVTHPEVDPAQYLGPVKEYLSRQPGVRAAWVFGQTPEEAGMLSYEIALLMNDPADKSLLDHVRAMAKALTPVEMDWTTSVMMADERSLKNLAKKHRAFYERKA